MSCGCENKRMAKEYGRIWNLAKGYARLEGVCVILFRKEDGTYDFAPAGEENDKNIVEYITPY